MNYSVKHAKQLSQRIVQKLRERGLPARSALAESSGELIYIVCDVLLCLLSLGKSGGHWHLAIADRRAQTIHDVIEKYLVDETWPSEGEAVARFIELIPDLYRKHVFDPSPD